MDARQNLKPLTPKLWFRGVERSWLDSRLRTNRDFEGENGRHLDVENLLADPLVLPAGLNALKRTENATSKKLSCGATDVGGRSIAARGPRSVRDFNLLKLIEFK